MQYGTRDCSTKHQTHGNLKFEVQVPQYENLEEFVSASGGDEQALKFVNGAVATSANNVARSTTRGSSAETADEAIALGRAASKKYQPTGVDRGPSKKAQLESFQSLLRKAKSGEAVSTEELAALAEKFGV